jgi:hypothetical protein
MLFSLSLSLLYCRFSSPLEAEKASSQPCLFLPNHKTLLAIHRMTVSLAKSLNIQLNSDGSGIISFSSDHHSSSNSRPSVSESTSLLPNNSNKSVGFGLGDGLRKRGTGGLSEKEERNGEKPKTASSSSSSAVEYEDIYLTHKRQKNICERIVDYFWSY